SGTLRCRKNLSIILTAAPPNELWLDPLYRGSREDSYISLPSEVLTSPIYPEHDNAYLKECIENLKEKGIEID
ncbi:MAG: hypothetical protein ACLUQY_06185, partial [Weissella confusa]